MAKSVSFTELGIRIGLTAIFLSLSAVSHSSYAAFFVPAILGFNLLRYLLPKERSLFELLSLSPAVGFSVLIILFYVSSLLGVGIKEAATFYTLIVIVSNFLPSRGRGFNVPLRDVLKFFLPITAVVLVHFVAYTYPTDNVDNFFHAVKIRYTLLSNSMFPQGAPFPSVRGYPGGYHAVVSYMVILTKSTIPLAMKDFRILAWAVLLLGVYLFAREWFGEKTAYFSLLSVLMTNLCYYYLIVYIEPNFFGFYFFLVMLVLLRKHFFGENSRELFVLVLLLGSSALLVHPYAFENYVLLGSLYALLGVREKRSLLSSSLILSFVVLPLLIFIILDPYFLGLRMGIGLTPVKVSHDNWGFLKLLIEWSTIRNLNYSGLLFMLSAFFVGIRRRNPEILSLFCYWAIVVVFSIVRIISGTPFLGPFKLAAVERMYLWLVPVLPVIIGFGMRSLYEFATSNRKKVLQISYFVLVAMFFLAPTFGTARDLVSAEANFYVTPDVLEDFHWLSNNVHSAKVLNSCYSDSAPWLPFFTEKNYTVMFWDYGSKACVYNNKTLNQTVETLLKDNFTMSQTIAFIDTNAPSLNPLWFLKRYELLRINENDWIFNLSSRNVSRNSVLVLNALRLCSPTIPGNTFKYGKYYVWGFTKKYYYVTYFAFNGQYYAWLFENPGVIAFNPCRSYKGVILDVLVTTKLKVKVTVNGKTKVYTLSPGENLIRVVVPIVKNRLNTIEIWKENSTLLLIKEVKLEG